MTSEVHLLPCEVQHNGTANVEQYFYPIPSTQNPDVLEASFRGRKLYGRRVELPTGFQGEVKSPTDPPVQFSSIIYWKREPIPNNSNPLIHAMEWPVVANKLMKPIDPKRVKDAIENHS